MDGVRENDGVRCKDVTDGVRDNVGCKDVTDGVRDSVGCKDVTDGVREKAGAVVGRDLGNKSIDGLIIIGIDSKSDSSIIDSVSIDSISIDSKLVSYNKSESSSLRVSFSNDDKIKGKSNATGDGLHVDALDNANEQDRSNKIDMG